MRENFQKAVQIVIDEFEGGDSIVTDSGGTTKYGIAQKWHPDINVRELSRTGAEEIYRREYWEPADCDELRWPLDLVIFDTAVNQGVAYARDLRTESLDAAEAILHRLARYANLADRNATLRIYLRGWVNRLVKLWTLIESEP